MEIKITEYAICQQETFYIIEIYKIYTMYSRLSRFLFTFVTHKL